MKPKTTAALTGLAAATAAVVLVSAGASQAAGTKSYAYGLDIVAQGESQVRQPYVESTDGSQQSTGGSIPDNPVLSGGILELTAGNDTASVSVADLTIGSALEQLPPEFAEAFGQLQENVCPNLPDDALPTEEVLNQIPVPLRDVLQTPESLQDACEALLGGDFLNLATIGALNVECTGDAGTVRVVNARLANSAEPLIADGTVPADTNLLPENPLLTVTVNRQTQNGEAFTVDGLVVNVGGQLEVVLASATCGEPLPTEPTVDEPGTPPLAPAPDPVSGRLPVTG